MGSGDAKETKRRVKGLKRKQNEKEGEDNIKKGCQSEELLMMSKFEMTPEEADYECVVCHLHLVNLCFLTLIQREKELKKT